MFSNCFSPFFFTCVIVATTVQDCLYLSAKSAPIASKPSSSLHTSHFQKAHSNLGRDWYIVYRIFDMLSRSNNLDKYAWRLTITDEYEIQAYSSEENLISIPKGVLDIANAGDTSALACIIAHEVAHHTLEHRSITLGNYYQLQNDKLREIDKKIRLADEQRKQREKTIAIWERNLAQPNLPSWAKTINEYGLALAKALPEPKPIDAEKLRQDATNQIDDQHYSNSRTQELEADRVGFLYFIRAGFDKEGCINMLDYLARRTGSKVDRDDVQHPTVQLRKEQILRLISGENIQQLIQDGKSNRLGKIPLSYELNKNLGWLRVNTRMGSALNDFKRLFSAD